MVTEGHLARLGRVNAADKQFRNNRRKKKKSNSHMCAGIEKCLFSTVELFSNDFSPLHVRNGGDSSAQAKRRRERGDNGLDR